MHYDFSTVQDNEFFVSIPEGVHVCRVAEVREGRARDGSVQWNLRLEAVDGEHAGRTAAWDSLTWSDRGVHRVKLVLEALGYDVRGEVELEPEELVGRRARVQLMLEEREDPLRGRRVVRLRVPYLGYEAAEAGADVDGWGAGDGSSRHDARGGSSTRARNGAGEAD